MFIFLVPAGRGAEDRIFTIIWDPEPDPGVSGPVPQHCYAIPIPVKDGHFKIALRQIAHVDRSLL